MGAANFSLGGFQGWLTMRLLTPFIVLGTAAGAITAGALGGRYKDSVLNGDVLLFLNTLVAAATAHIGSGLV